MMTDQTIAEQTAPSILQTLCPAGVRVSQVSLEITQDATEESLVVLDRMLDEVGSSHLYHVGDYINYLARTQGESVARKRISDSYKPETRRLAAWVCRKVANERRLISPSFGHSIEVAKLDPTEQEIWLTRARTEKLTTKQLRAEVRQRETSSTSTSSTMASQAPVDQAAARAFEAYQVFAAWYVKHQPEFTADQGLEWDAALLTLVTDYVARMDDEGFERLCQARLTYLKR